MGDKGVGVPGSLGLAGCPNENGEVVGTAVGATGVSGIGTAGEIALDVGVNLVESKTFGVASGVVWGVCITGLVSGATGGVVGAAMSGCISGVGELKAIGATVGCAGASGVRTSGVKLVSGALLCAGSTEGVLTPGSGCGCWGLNGSLLGFMRALLSFCLYLYESSIALCDSRGYELMEQSGRIASD